MADNTTTKLHVNLPFMTRLKLHASALAKLVYIRRDGTINRRVLNLLDLKNSAPATRRICKIPVSTSDILVDSTRNLWFRLFVPMISDTNNPSNHELPLIFYFHGGGFNTFGPNSQCYDDLCCHLAAKVPAIIASINYRLAPEFRYPCQYEDCYDALKFINTHNHTILPANTDLNKCFIGGDSAGGNIAHHVTLRACQNSNEFDKIKIIGLVQLQPFFGGEERTESEVRLNKLVPVLNIKETDRMWRLFLPEGADRNHGAVNVLNSETEKEMKSVEFPSALVIVGGYDPLQDWQKRYIHGMKNCGKEVELIQYPNAFHGFYAFPELPEFASFITNVKMFVRNKAYPN